MQAIPAGGSEATFIVLVGSTCPNKINMYARNTVYAFLSPMHACIIFIFVVVFFSLMQYLHL